MRVGKVWITSMIVGAALLAVGANAQSPALPAGTLQKSLPSAVSPTQKLPVQPLPAGLPQQAPAAPVPGFQPKTTVSNALTMIGNRVEFQQKSAMAAGLTMVGNRVEFQPKSAMAAGLTMVGNRVEFQPKSAMTAELRMVGTQ